MPVLDLAVAQRAARRGSVVESIDSCRRKRQRLRPDLTTAARRFEGSLPARILNKDLGVNTAKAAAAMTGFKRDSTWRMAE